MSSFKIIIQAVGKMLQHRYFIITVYTILFVFIPFVIQNRICFTVEFGPGFFDVFESIFGYVKLIDEVGNTDG